MTEFGVSPEDLRRLARLVEENGLSELRYEEGDLRITLRTAAYRPAAPVTSAAPSLPGEEVEPGFFPSPEPAATPEPASATSSVPMARIEAPVMGVFYRANAPGALPFIEVGDLIEIGQPVGMIEAMKVFSEVLSEVAGRVREIPVRNGALVQPHETLVVVEEIA